MSNYKKALTAIEDAWKGKKPSKVDLNNAANNYMSALGPWGEVDAADAAIRCLEAAVADGEVKVDQSTTKDRAKTISIKCNEDRAALSALLDGLKNFRAQQAAQRGDTRPSPEKYAN